MDRYGFPILNAANGRQGADDDSPFVFDCISDSGIGADGEPCESFDEVMEHYLDH